MTLQFPKPYDLVVIGGGPAGIMAALSAKKHFPDISVVIIDRSKELGRKIAISGAGRGNITNNNLRLNPEDNYFGDKNFITRVFSKFGFTQITDFFENLGVPLYEEKKTGRGKIFPVIDHAKTVRDMLVDEILHQKIEICYETPLTDIRTESGKWFVQTTKGLVQTKNVILATGGKTYPALGSDGAGLELAKKLGHTIITPVPSAVPLVSKNPLSHYLQGEKMVLEVNSSIGGKSDKSEIGDVMFTQYGLSGPAILDLSRNISVRINRDGKTDTEIQLSFFPKMPPKQVEDILTLRLKQHPEYPVAHCLWGLVTEKIAGGVCGVAKIPKEKIARELTSSEKQLLLSVLTAYKLPISATRSWNEAEFTAGGIDTSEVDPVNLQSRKLNALYFAGEILNVDGAVGGFNLSWAWVSGWVAGQLGLFC
jgi:predicted Rossmann fold flavoprotein